MAKNTFEDAARGLTVAYVIDATRVVLNRGHEDGIKFGERFIVYSISRDEIRDPITKESLGRLELVKGIGKIVSVQPKISILESDEYASRLFAIPFGEPAKKPFDDPHVGDLVRKINP